MGKSDRDLVPSPNPATPLGESAASLSLHAHTAGVSSAPQRYFDDDPTELADDDLPPLYSDHEHDAPAGPFGVIDPLLPSGAAPLEVQPFLRDKVSGTEYYLDRRLDTDPVFLATHLDRLAQLPPRPHVHIRGTHHQSVRKEDGKSERRQVVDFDIHIELTHLLYQDIQSRQPFLRHVATAGHFEKVRRGTVFATRAPGFGGSGGAAEEGVPDLAEWCRRFCASRAGLKNFVLERRVLGWDFDLLRTKLEALVRSTNYRGHVAVDFPVLNARAEVYNDCRTNRWRLTKWIEMLFVFTLLFLFSWPWLFFRTARWEVASAQWHMSSRDAQGRKRYASVSEDRWYNMWARPVQRAVLERRQGTLDQGDLNRVDAPPQSGFAGAVQAGVEAMGVVNRSFGWGGDS